jgi:hypothetical protein
MVLLLSALVVFPPAARAQDKPALPPPPALVEEDSLGRSARPAATEETQGLSPRPAAMPDSLGGLADSLTTAADSAAARSVLSRAWSRFWRRPAHWPAPARLHPPNRRPLPTPAAPPDRPAEDLADGLLPLAAGLLYDQAHLGHRQLLALDGLRPGASTLELDGLDLASRISGLADLNLVAGGLVEEGRTAAWERLGNRPGGALAFHSLRATDDSVLTRLRWADGFLGLITVEGDFRRPVLGGRATLASRQSYTHERVPGAHYRGNLFLWNWDRPLGERWLLQLDQRLLHDRSEILDFDRSQRRLDQSLLRGRVTRLLTDQSALGLDLWRREDRLGFQRLARVDDRETLRGATLHLDRSWAGGGWRVVSGLERQELSAGSWRMERGVARLAGRAAWTIPSSLGRLVLEPAGELRRFTGDDLRGWSLGGHAGLQRGEGWGDLILQAGQLPPTPEQLHLTRLPAQQDAMIDPWLREAALPLLPDSTLGGSRWLRQELRLGTRLAEGRLPLSLRVWRVALADDPRAAPATDSSWIWRGEDHVNWGVQLFADLALTPRWRLRTAQGWFMDSRGLVSREFPSYLLDGALTHERRLFGEELLVQVTAGLHHEHGGVDAQGRALWEMPEFWLKAEATRGRFTLWWALRNPFSLAENQRVEGRPLHGHEEWLGIRWGFVD